MYIIQATFQRSVKDSQFSSMRLRIACVCSTLDREYYSRSMTSLVLYSQIASSLRNDSW